MQRLLGIIVLIAAAALAGPPQALAQDSKAGQTFPAADWAAWDKPESAGYRAAGLEAAEQMLYRIPTTSMMIVVSGKVAYRYGDIGQASYLASARKSILSMLYGKYVANGTINLDRTLGELGIDEDSGLLPIEKTARVRDLLVASSGVYHPAGSP